MVLSALFAIFIGLSGGLAVGGGFVAFLTVLGVFPRLIQLTKTLRFVRLYEWGIVMGAVYSSWISLRDITFDIPAVFLAGVGLLGGMFVGMLAAALTEVLNVLPILAKRIGIEEKILVLLMAIVFGKIFGSLFQWVYFVKQ